MQKDKSKFIELQEKKERPYAFNVHGKVSCSDRLTHFFSQVTSLPIPGNDKGPTTAR